MQAFQPYLFWNQLRHRMASPVVSLTCAVGSFFGRCRIITLAVVGFYTSAPAATYTVSDKATLQTRMNAALPGDTVIVANGTYNWGQIIFANNNGTPASAWIVLKAQSFRGVVFNGSTYLQFKGTRVKIDGFRFADGNSGTNAVISFRSSSSSLSNYCRITNIIIDNYNTYSADSSIENEWVGIYGTNNRVDHCTFINKFNARATIVVWYGTTAYPNPASSTYHAIDSNYFKGRSYQGANGGETIRVGDSNSSRTDGFNTIEYNLFEGLTQAEPEIISNKSDFNTYRCNTFRNSQGGLTLRHGRYCDVYSNFFIVDDASVTQAYGIRVIDKGHRIFNNYIEAVNGNASGGTTQLRAPINLYNGLSADTTDATAASGYFAADSCLVAFNTIVNAKGGGGIVLGGIGGGTVQPKGVVVANNIIRMTTGTAVYLNPGNTSLTYYAEGNLYQAPSGTGLASSTGFTNASLTFGAKANGILSPPAFIIDAAINSSSYAAYLNNVDAQGQSRSAVFDAGADEINSSAPVINFPLDSNLVGAGKPSLVLPVHLISFEAALVNESAQLSWKVENEVYFDRYEVETSIDGNNYKVLGVMIANGISIYRFTDNHLYLGKRYYRLKLVDKDGRYTYSATLTLNFSKSVSYNVYPNPADHFVFVEWMGMIPPGAGLVLSDASGKQIQRSLITSNITKISLQGLPPGMYYLRVFATAIISKNHPLIIN